MKALSRLETKIPTTLKKSVKLRYDSTFERVISVAVFDISDEDRRQAVEAITERLEGRLSVNTVKDLLGRVKLMTGSKNRTQEDLSAELNVYAEALAKQPAYAVYKVLWEWPDGHEWWPTYAELTGAIDRECSKYRQTLKALNDAPEPVKRGGYNPEDREYVLAGFERLSKQLGVSK